MRKALTWLCAASILAMPVHAASDPVADGPAAQDEPKLVATFFMRATVVPRADDLAILKQGQKLMLSSMQGGFSIVEYSVVDGKIAYAVTSGSISDKDRKAIDKAIAKMQKQL